MTKGIVTSVVKRFWLYTHNFHYNKIVIDFSKNWCSPELFASLFMEIMK